MINLAGDKDCDKYVEKELKEAGVEPTKFSFILKGEVPTRFCGFLDGWIFERAWTYWVVKSNENLLLFKYADKLHEKYGEVVRVNGDCTGPSPHNHYRTWSLGVSLYHVDSKDGLNALVKAIKTQTKETKNNEGE